MITRDDTVAPEPNRLVQVPQEALATLELQLSGTKSFAACKDRIVVRLEFVAIAVAFFNRAFTTDPMLRMNPIKSIALSRCIMSLVKVFGICVWKELN